MRNRSVLFALPALALLNPAAMQARDHAPAPPTLSASDKAHVLGDTFTVVKTVKQMPAAVQKALGLPPKKPLYGMADAGKPFEIGDVVSDKLPPRRLVFAAVNAQYCLVYFDQGGMAYNQHIVLFRLHNGSPVRVWHATYFAKPSLTFAQLQEVIRQGKYRQSSY